MSFTLSIDPDAVLDVAFDWTPWLGEGETIASHTTHPSSGITVDDSDEADGIVTVWVSGAEDKVQRVTCRVVTNQGRTDDRTIKFTVLER